MTITLHIAPSRREDSNFRAVMLALHVHASVMEVSPEHFRFELDATDSHDPRIVYLRKHQWE